MKPAIALLLTLAAVSGCETRGSVFATSPISTASTLSSLQVTAGSLTPQFGAETMSYTVAVQNTTTNLVIRAVPTNAGATVTVNGSAVSSAGESAPIILSVGANSIPVVVRAQNGLNRTYTVNVNRAAP